MGLLSEEEAERCLAMADDRNLPSHTYIEAVPRLFSAGSPTTENSCERCECGSAIGCAGEWLGGGPRPNVLQYPPSA